MNAPSSGRYIFDITDMVRFACIDGPVTGIPRVALMLASEAARLRPDQVEIGYFDAVARTYQVLANPALASDPDQLRAHLRMTTRHVGPVKFWKYGPRSIRSQYHAIARRLKLGILRARPQFARQANSDREISLERADKVICLGSSWDSLDFISHLGGSGASARSGEFIVLVHDLIPLLPQTWPGVVDSRLYRHWLERILGANASLLFYSSSTERDLGFWLKTQGYEQFSSRRFRLADELIATPDRAIREEVQRLADKPFMLMVGSMKGRKNGTNLLKALQQLQSASNGRSILRLVAAGSSTGRDVKDLLPGGLNPLDLVFVTNPNDAELSWLYSHCRFTVYPSLYEGWGLPVGESLWHGKVCATSNSSSMPEVGGDACDYFDPRDPDDIARVLRPLMVDDDYLKKKEARIEGTQLKSWRDSAHDLLAVLDLPSRLIDCRRAA